MATTRLIELAVKEIKPSDEYARDNFVKVAQRMSPKASMHDILCKWERLEPWEQVTWERSSKLMKTLEKVEQANKRKRKKENAAKQQETEQTESQQVEPRSPKKHGTEVWHLVVLLPHFCVFLRPSNSHCSRWCLLNLGW